MQEEFLMRLLEEKEERAQKQKSLLKLFPKTLISFGLNIPGEVKNSENIHTFFQRALQTIEQKLEEKQYLILHREVQSQETGNLAFLIVDSEDALSIKKFLVELEETLVYGRILDIDVLDKKAQGISRAHLQVSPRKCLLCEEEAVFCMRNKSHSYEALHAKAMEYITMGG